MNPDPATNPTPETPTPLDARSKVPRQALKILRGNAVLLGQHVADDAENRILSYITDLERALAEAKRENEKRKDDLDVTHGMLKASRENVRELNDRIAVMDDDYEKLRTETERLKAERQWQPMVSAPMDGTDILLRIKTDTDDKPWIVLASWQCRTHCFLSSLHECPNEPDCKGGWYLSACFLSDDVEPLGWMPLPSAAIDSASEGQG